MGPVVFLFFSFKTKKRTAASVFDCEKRPVSFPKFCPEISFVLFTSFLILLKEVFGGCVLQHCYIKQQSQREEMDLTIFVFILGLFLVSFVSTSEFSMDYNTVLSGQTYFIKCKSPKRLAIWSWYGKSSSLAKNLAAGISKRIDDDR